MDEERKEGNDRSIWDILERLSTGGVTVEQPDAPRERLRARADDAPSRRRRQSYDH